MGEQRYSSNILDLGTLRRLAVIFMILSLYLWRKSPQHPLDRRPDGPDGPQSRSGFYGEDKKLLTLRESNTAVWTITPYTD
jgi:hypothetical protein